MPATEISVPVCTIDPRKGFMRGRITAVNDDGEYVVTWDGGGPAQVMAPGEAQAKLMDPVRLGEDGIRELLWLRDGIEYGNARIAELMVRAALADI